MVPAWPVPPPPVPPPVPPPPPPLPHATAPQAKDARSISIPSIVRQLRRRAGMPKSKRQASVTPPVVYQGIAPRLGNARVALVAAVVEIVRVAVPAAAPAMLTGLVDPKLRVGRY